MSCCVLLKRKLRIISQYCFLLNFYLQSLAVGVNGVIFSNTNNNSFTILRIRRAFAFLNMRHACVAAVASLAEYCVCVLSVHFRKPSCLRVRVTYTPTRDSHWLKQDCVHYFIYLAYYYSLLLSNSIF